jgi:hypothetical protein
MGEFWKTCLEQLTERCVYTHTVQSRLSGLMVWCGCTDNWQTRIIQTGTLLSHEQKIKQSQWPRGLWRRTSAASLLRLWVRIPPRAWMFFCCECCVLSGRGLCDGLITRPEEPYRLWSAVVCEQETSKTRRLKPATGLWKYNHNGL